LTLARSSNRALGFLFNPEVLVVQEEEEKVDFATIRYAAA
jgi:hypothetical protein